MNLLGVREGARWDKWFRNNVGLALSLGLVLSGTGCGTRKALGCLGLWVLIWRVG